MKKQALAVLAAVLTLMVAGFGVLLVRSGDEGGSSNTYQAPQVDPREVACIQSGGSWTRVSAGNRAGVGSSFGKECKTRAELESELAEEARQDFCRGLPERMARADIPQKCLDFYEPVTTPTTSRSRS